MSSSSALTVREAESLVRKDSQFLPGDHLRRNYGIFDHHAIFIKWVDFRKKIGLLVQHTGKKDDPMSTEMIEAQEEALTHHRLSTRPTNPASVIRRALSRVGEGGYNLIFKNCEHFTSWCLTGEASSKQILRGSTHVAGHFVSFVAPCAGAVLIATGLALEMKRDIDAYQKGQITKRSLGRKLTVAISGTAGGVGGMVAGAKIGQCVLGGVGMAVGGAIGALAGGHGAASAAQNLLDYFFSGDRNDSLQRAYQFLGVPRTATNIEINQAYRELARKYHPDRPTGSHEQFVMLQMAMEVIQASRDVDCDQEPFPAGSYVKFSRKCLGLDLFYPARVVLAHCNQTYDIAYGNGDYEFDVDIGRIRPV